MTGSRVWRNGEAYRAATELGVEESAWEQARRRAARWHAWLTSPECTLQDLENFERWRRDATNAAAYAALCTDFRVPEPSRALADASAFASAACAAAPASGRAAANLEIRLRADAP